jgi:hypothetical protein
MGIRVTKKARSQAEIVLNLLTMSHTTIKEVAAELALLPRRVFGHLHCRLEQTAGVIAEALAILEGAYTLAGPKTVDDPHT